MWISLLAALALQAGIEETRWLTDYKEAVALSGKLQRPLLIFAARETCPNCKAMETQVQPSAAIRDILSQQFVCVRVDADQRPPGAAKHLERVSGETLPFYAFTTPAGEFVGGVSGYRNKETFKADLEAILRSDLLKVAGVSAKPTFPEHAPEHFAAAKEAGKSVLIFIYDQSPATDTVNRTLTDPLLRDFRDRLRITQSEYKKGGDLCSRFEIIRAPTLLLLDPSREKPEEQVRGRIAGSRGPRDLIRDLEQLLAGSPGAASKPVATPPPTADALRDQDLSDDEVDRRFIQSRIVVAIEANKRGRKAKAVEILEDLLQSYPKHVLGKRVKELLEELRK